MTSYAAQTAFSPMGRPLGYIALGLALLEAILLLAWMTYAVLMF